MRRFRSLRPLFLPGVLGLGAVLTGGLAGVIAGFLAALILIDRWLDRLISFTGWGMYDAERRFRRLERERRVARLLRRHADLVHLPDDTGWAALAQRRRLGVRPIAVSSIVGTVDEHKAVAFDSQFRPPHWSRGRWTQMSHAAQEGVPMSPIAVYRVGDRHFVRDGHHRVSIARSLGTERIDADVVELLQSDASQRSTSAGLRRRTTG